MIRQVVNMIHLQNSINFINDNIYGLLCYLQETKYIYYPHANGYLFHFYMFIFILVCTVKLRGNICLTYINNLQII